jgi:hypothetical protein
VCGALVALTLALVTGALADPNQYLCLVERSAGLHYDSQSGSWEPQTFVAGRKYILRRLNDDDRKDPQLQHYPKANWGFFLLEKEFPTAICEEVTEFSIFNCHPEYTDASFDKGSRRFEIVNRGAYVDQGFWERRRREDSEEYSRSLSRREATDVSHPQDLFVEIGHCSSF